MKIKPSSNQKLRILCVRLDSLGDVLMTEPALRGLHESFPESNLSLLTSAAGARAAAMIPYLDEVITYEAPWMKAAGNLHDRKEDAQIIKQLRHKHFDCAIIFTVYTQNPLPAAMLCYLAGIPERMAYCRENPYQLLTHWVQEHEPHIYRRHEVERQLALIAEMGACCSDDAIQIAIPQAMRDKAELIWRSLVPHGKYRIVVHPGASAASRRYPAERFAEAMRFIQAQLSAVFVVTGDASENLLTEEVALRAGLAAHSMAGQLDTIEWAAMIDAADLLLSNNTGAVHVAAATRTPVVDIYALTNPQHTPWRTPAQVLSNEVPCKNCYKSICPEGHHRCLLGIDAPVVAQAVIDLIDCTLTNAGGVSRLLC